MILALSYETGALRHGHHGFVTPAYHKEVI